MHFIQLAASVTAIFSSVAVAAPKFAVEKRSTGPARTDPDFINAILTTHNAHRMVHQVANLTWDDTLAKFAEKAGNKCQFAHTGGPYGENLFAIWPGYDDWTEGTVDGVEAWINEVKSYNYKQPGFSDSTGHYTQAVWKASTKVGCSWNTINCDGAAYLFCEYNPPGNVVGYFQQNVFPYKYKH